MTALDLAKQWLKYAQSDLNTAIHMFYNVNPKESEISCYHAHQSAEKSLKAFLIQKEIAPPHSHDLVELSHLCSTIEPGFSSMQSDCASLNPYGVHVRYPNELSVDDIITQKAIESAKKLFAFCDNLINKAHE